jgi:Flp pilus assembly protein TadD
VHLDRAKGLGLQAAQLSYNRARALFDLYRLDEAETELSDAVSRAPGYVNAHVFLAKLRFMRGQEDFARSFRSARVAGHGGLALALAHGDLLRRSGDLPGAEDVLRGLLGEPDQARTVQAALSVVLQEQERLPEALAMAQEALVARPDDAIRVENLVAILLSLGRASEALPHIRNRQQSAGHDQRWLTYEATAARVLGLPEHEYLFDIARFVHKFALEPPPGWSSIGEFNADLLAVLQTRHQFVNAPLDQSLRAGSQTARSLLSDPDPVVRAFLTTLTAPMREYCARLGSDPAHPFVSRNVGATQLTGCWSVRLGRSGHHVNHIHPMGWVSSAYYVQVPDEVEDAERHGGWIKFGEPRYPVPGIGPLAYVKPEVGHLVLFPSYLWHGTVPIESGQPRITVAFDAVPDPGAASGGGR